MARAAERLQALQAKIGPRTGARAAVGDTQPDGGSHAELWLYGVVGGYWFGFSAKSVGDQLRGLDVDQLTVRIHSPGGSVFEGIAIANLLRNHKANVTVVVDGLAASSASIIALAGDDIVMSPGSQFMIHDAWTFLSGNEKELRQEADWIGKQSANLSEQYAAKAGGTAAEWRARMTAEPDGTWYTAQESVDAGLANRIGTVAAATPAPEPPQAPLEDDNADLEDSAAYLLDAMQLHPAALAAWTPGHATPKPPSASAVGSTETEGGSAVALNLSDEQATELRNTLGLADDADTAAIIAAAAEAAQTKPKATEANTAPPIPEGMTLVEKGVMDQLRSDAAAGRSAADTLAKQERDTAIMAAITAGKTTPARKEHWEKSWDADAEGTKTLLDSLEPGLVPVAELGHDQAGDAEAALTPEDAAEIDNFLSGLGLNKEDLNG